MKLKIPIISVNVNFGIADLFKLGVVTSASSKGPVDLALPLNRFRYLFPRLWPEAEANTA